MIGSFGFLILEYCSNEVNDDPTLVKIKLVGRCRNVQKITKVQKILLQECATADLKLRKIAGVPSSLLCSKMSNNHFILSGHLRFLRQLNFSFL